MSICNNAWIWGTFMSLYWCPSVEPWSSWCLGYALHRRRDEEVYLNLHTQYHAFQTHHLRHHLIDPTQVMKSPRTISLPSFCTNSLLQLEIEALFFLVCLGYCWGIHTDHHQVMVDFERNSQTLFCHWHQQEETWGVSPKQNQVLNHDAGLPLFQTRRKCTHCQVLSAVLHLRNKFNSG